MIFDPSELPGLPDSVLETAEFAPVEDIVLPLLRDALPGARIYTEIPAKDMFPYAIVRVHPTERWWSGDDRFIDWAAVFVHVFTENPDGDRQAAIFSDAIRVALRDAWMNQTTTEYGWITDYRMTPVGRSAY